jgi:hypothetical protein
LCCRRPRLRGASGPSIQKAGLVSRHRSDFASVSLEMISHFRQTQPYLRDFMIEIGESIQSDETGVGIALPNTKNFTLSMAYWQEGRRRCLGCQSIDSCLSWHSQYQQIYPGIKRCNAASCPRYPPLSIRFCPS